MTAPHGPVGAAAAGGRAFFGAASTLGITRPAMAHAMAGAFAETSEQKARPGSGGGPGQEQGSHLIRALPALPLTYLLA
jgi:hypothetical protein